jgi:hypothetical protein
VDTTASELAAARDAVTVSCIDKVPAMTSLSWTDNCDDGGTVAGVDEPLVGDACGGTITRTWNISDACVNPGITRTQIITVDDNTVPALTGTLPSGATNQDLCFNAIPSGPTIEAIAALYSDNCGGAITVEKSETPTGDDCSWSVTYHYTVKDKCGNFATAVDIIYSGGDKTNPVVTCPANFSVDCGTATVFGTPTVFDNCDANPELTHVDSTNPDLGQFIRTWTATDDCGNKSTCSQTITVGFCDHLYPTATTCCSYRNGSAQAFTKVCYTTKGTKVSNAAPGVFFYYAKIIAPSTSFSVDVLQAKGCSELRLFLIQEDQIILWDVNCNKASNATITPQSSDGKATISINGAVAGNEYVISVKYDTKSIVGTTFPKDGNCTYTFKSQIGGITVPGSVGQITASKNCQVGTISAGTCSVSAPTSTSTVAKTAETIAPIDAKIETVGFDAYPVPFKDQLTIKYNFDYESDVKIEVFNAQGISVLSKTDANGYLNKEVTLELHANKDQGQVNVVKVTTNRGSSTKKVMSSK